MCKTILIVDDDEGIRGNYTDILVEQGYQVAECNEAQGWFDRFSCMKFDLFVLDISLHGDRMAGHELCLSIKTKLPGTRVAMLTSIDDEANRRIAVQNGADAYWIKSGCLAGFLEEVEQILS